MVGIVSTFTDITVRKEMEKEVQEAREKLDQDGYEYAEGFKRFQFR